jgi:hypothetical protein
LGIRKDYKSRPEARWKNNRCNEDKIVFLCGKSRENPSQKITGRKSYLTLFLQTADTLSLAVSITCFDKTRLQKQRVFIRQAVFISPSEYLL